MAYEIVPYCDEYESAVAALERVLWFGDVELNTACLRWKYAGNPYPDESQMFVALDQGRVVGVRGLMCGRWEACRGAGATPVAFEARAAADLVIAPTHRNKGLYRELNECALEHVANDGCAVVFNFSAGAANRIALLAGGWRQSFAIERSVHDPVPGIVDRLKQRFNPNRHLVAVFDDLVFVERNGVNGRLTTSDTARAADMAELVERAPWDGRIRQLRDEAFFEWKFASPFAINRFVYCEDQDALRGYLVLQAKRHRQMSLAIVDFEAENDEVLAELLTMAVRWAHRGRIELWRDAMYSRCGERCDQLELRSIGAARGVRGEGPAVLVRTLNSAGVADIENASGRSLHERDDWDLRPVYSDAY